MQKINYLRLLGLGGKLSARLYGRFHFDGIVTVQRTTNRMMDLLFFRYDTGDGTERAQRQRPCNRIVRMHYGKNALYKLVNVDDFLEVFFALLTHSQHPQAQQIRPITLVDQIKLPEINTKL